MAYTTPPAYPTPPPPAYAPTPRDPTNVVGRRFVAYAIDLFVVALVTVIVGVALAKRYANMPASTCDLVTNNRGSTSCYQVGSHVYVLKDGRAAAVWGIGLLAALLNSVVLQGLSGASLGKLVLGLRVVDRAGNRAGLGRNFVRWLLLIVDWFPYCFPLVGSVAVLTTRPHRRVGDMVANTYVVGANNVGTPVADVVPPMGSAAHDVTTAGPYVPPPPGSGWAPPASETQPGWAAPGASATPPAPTWPPSPAPGPPPDESSWGAPPPPAWGAPPPPGPGSPPPWQPSAPQPATEEPAPSAEPEAPAPEPNPWGAPPPATPPSWGQREEGDDSAES